MRSLRRFLAALVIVLTLTLGMALQASAAPCSGPACLLRDNPQVHPIGMPVVLLFIAPALIFLPPI